LSRLQREIEVALEYYRAEPEEARHRVEEAMRICVRTLTGADLISGKTKEVFRGVVESVIMTGFLSSGGWAKVHAALAAAAPALYAELKEVLPSAGNQSIPF